MSTAAEKLLETYRQKRDFTLTKEPAGGAASADGLAFCIQKHDATRLHYDFRVEWDGVLKSWAVTRGPSLDPADKRLAVRTEDHPMDYGDFEGTIPAGQYGGGTVMLWDRGTWEPQGDAAKGLADGNLKMVLHGEKLTGRWALIRMKSRGRETRENWLLIKEKDEVASDRIDILKQDRSVKTGRTLAEIAEGDESWTRPTKRPGTGKTETPAAAKPRAGRRPVAAKRSPPAKRKGTPPSFEDVQLATLVEEVPAGAEWLNEMKYDGYRVLMAVGGGAATLYTRTGKDWTDRFAPLVPALQGLSCESALIDGEIVAFDEKGGTDFSTLQERLGDGGPLACFCFDLLSLDGTDLRASPLRERKALLEALLAPVDDAVLKYSQHITGNGASVLRSICEAGHEGLVAKRADAPYTAGRNRNWLKIKCERRQEFVIGGFAVSDKRARPFASLLVGVFEKGRFVYRGRVGSGFTQASIAQLAAKMKAIARKTPAFETLAAPIRRGARFVEPKLVAEISFAEMTADGLIRHGVFKGLREDKPAGEIGDERPAATEKPVAPRGRGKGDGDPVQIAGVRLTSPDRVVFKSVGVTKRDLAVYYEAVAERMLAHAGDRPISLVRCPTGGRKGCFFQKHDSGGFPEAIGHVELDEKDGEKAVYLSLPDAAAIVAAVQMSAQEFHIWGSRNASLERPDRLVFDLDPDEALTFADVRQAALDLRDRLARVKLEAWPLVTGGKGVHLVLPLARRQDWTEVKSFAAAVARKMEKDEPERFVSTMSKAKRRGRIFVDWLRNERGQTAIAPYSTRAREGAPVATPVSWAEFETLDRANGFRLADVVERLGQPDPWADYFDRRQSITKVARAAFEA